MRADDERRECEDQQPGQDARPRSLRPDMPAAEGLRQVLAGLESGLDPLEARIALAHDAEALHQHRVILRTSRALLSNLGSLAPLDLAERFSVPFAALGRRSSQARDLDVWIAGFDQLLSGFGWDEPESLDPLRKQLGLARDRAWSSLRAHLDSIEHRRLREDWRNSLSMPWPAEQSTQALASEIADALEHRLGRLREHGRALSPGSPTSAFHEQRKRAKKVRYLVQRFGELLDPDQLERFLRPLRRLQNALGKLQDLATEADSIRRFADDFAADLDPRCLLAMGALGARIMQREQSLRALSLKRMRQFEGNRRTRLTDRLIATLRESAQG